MVLRSSLALSPNYVNYILNRCFQIINNRFRSVDDNETLRARWGIIPWRVHCLQSVIDRRSLGALQCHDGNVRSTSLSSLSL